MKRRYMTLAAGAAAAAITSWVTIAPSDNPTVNAVLSKVPVVDKVPQVPGYERGCGIDKKTKAREACVFGPEWNDPNDHSGCNTRNRILAAQLQDVKFKPRTHDCKVVAGWRNDPYTGAKITLGQVQIDHVFPEHRAWNLGAAQWDIKRRITFANDPSNLLAVSGKANEAKRDSGIGKWLPPNPVERCPYVMRYLTVAASYHLSITTSDRDAAITTCQKGESS